AWLASDRRDEPLLLLLLGAEPENRGRRHLRLDVDSHRQTTESCLRHLLGQDHSREVVPALATVFGRIAEAKKAEFPKAPEDRIGERRLFPLVEVRLHLLLQKPADV